MDFQEIIADLRVRTIARWIKLNDAAAYSGIGRNRLKALAKSGTVRGFPDPDSKRGDWVFDRESLNEYRERQLSEFTGQRESARSAALRIVASVTKSKSASPSARRPSACKK